MLKLTKNEKEILDSLLTMNPKVVALKLKIPVSKVYSTKHYFKRKVQNACEFLGVAKSVYAGLLKKRLRTPKIMPSLEENLYERGLGYSLQKLN